MSVSKYYLLLLIPLFLLLLVPAFAQTMTIIVVGTNIAGAGDAINITVMGAYQTVGFEIIASDGEIIDTFYFVASEQGDIKLLWILSKDMEPGIYTVTVTDNYNFAETAFQYPFDDSEITITVYTDKSSYTDGDTIIISGEVSEIIDGTPVSVIVKSFDGNLIFIVQLEVGTDKKYSTEMTAGGELMKIAGTYVVEAQYGTSDRTAETTFEYYLDELTLIITTDKLQYYANDDIIISGVLSNMTDITNYTISYEITSTINYEIITSGYSDSLNDDGTFSFTLNATDRETWNESSEDVLLSVDIEDNHAEHVFYLSSDIELSDEILYDLILINNNTNYTQQLEIQKIQHQLDTLMKQHKLFCQIPHHNKVCMP